MRGEAFEVEQNIYHRILVRGPGECELVRLSGVLWGKVARMVAGNGPPCVRAYVGPLRKGDFGYNFTTTVPPSRIRPHLGRSMAIWEEASPGVQDVVGQKDTVCISVVVLDDT